MKIKIFIFISIIFISGFIIPESKIIPVKNASGKDWNQKSFWYEPLLWEIDNSTQGYKKAFFIDPNKYLLEK